MATKITVPAIKRTTTSHQIEFVDGIIINLTGSNTIATRKAAYEKAYLLANPPVVVPLVEPPSGEFELRGSGSGRLELGVLTNKRIKIKPGVYDYINLAAASKSVIDATGVIITKKNVFDIGPFEGLELFGLSASDHNYRPVIVGGYSNGLYLHHCNFKNVVGFCISYEYAGIYDGTPNTVSKDWRIENNTYENTSDAFFQQATYTDKGITNLFRNFTFKNNKTTGGSNVMEMKAVDGYTITGNTVDGVNADNNEHNGVFKIWGNGVFSGNKVTNHQGNAIRAWSFAFGDEGKSVIIDHNTVFNSRKYGALELNVPPEICEYRNKYPSRIKPVNVKVFNNTAGKLAVVHKTFDGQMLDIYNTDTYKGDWGGTIEYYNNLGFEMFGPQRPITDMINNMSNFKIIRNDGNKYFPTSAQAVEDTINFKSKFQGIGAQ